MLNYVEKEEFFTFAWKDVKLQNSPRLCFWSYNAGNSFYFGVRKLILYQIMVVFSKTVSFDDFVHVIDDENIVTFVEFDCGNNFYLGAPTKVEQINLEGKNISRSSEKPKCITIRDQHSCSIYEEHNSKNFWIVQLIGHGSDSWSHSTTLILGNLCPISTLKNNSPN